MNLIVGVLGAAVAFAIVIGLLIVYTRRVADVALTDQFRAGEAIVEGRIPARWVTKIKRRLALRGVLRLLGRDASAEELVLAKMDGLLRFFERSPFFENAETRSLLLTQLRETRAGWTEMTWDELLSACGSSAHSDESSDSSM